MKDDLIFAPSVTCATLKKAILTGWSYFLGSILCFVCVPSRTPCSEGAVWALFLNIYFSNMLSTCQQKQNRQTRAVFENCCSSPLGDNLYYTPFIVITLRLCLYRRCVYCLGEDVCDRWAENRSRCSPQPQGRARPLPVCSSRSGPAQGPPSCDGFVSTFLQSFHFQ